MNLLSPPPKTLSPMSTFYILLILLVSSSTLLAVASENVAAATLTVYEVLEEYDFPVGILPKGVLGYELDNSTGKFSVYLNGTCKFSIDSYELEYKSTITGVISTDKLKSLSGIKVKVVWFWFSITEVTRDGEELDFSIGISSTDFPVENFVESPTCGCGFDCDDVNQNVLDEYVSSE